MNAFAKAMIFFGIILVVAGLVLLGFQKQSFLGKLPGDLLIKRENVTFYFPLTTGIILSILISFILYLLSRFR